MKDTLHLDLRHLLATLRARRGFDARSYIDAKVKLLNDYCSRSGITALVFGLSGGIDSALVTALIAEAMKQPGSPIKRSVALLMPYYIKEGTTNQLVATSRGHEVASAFGCECRLLDLSDSHRAMTRATDKALGVESNAWAKGQLVSYLRTPALYQMATLIRQQGFPCIVIGTCNRDEGGYIGYFGKAADYMTDLHLISDLHKSEVRACAEALGVPQSVLDATPTGDIYDGRNDRELIGAPYDFIELYQLLLCHCQLEQAHLLQKLGPPARRQFGHFGSRLQQLNRENAHKYLVGSPSVHLDVLERAVPGGSRPEQFTAPAAAPDVSKFVNTFKLNAPVIARLRRRDLPARRARLSDFGNTAFMAHRLVTAGEAHAITSQLETQGWVPADQNGKSANFDPTKDTVGSWRASTYSPEFASILWHRLAPMLPVLRFAEQAGPSTDFGNYPVWRAVGVSSLMRFIKYTDGGLLVPHYDAPFDFHDGKRTLMSLVLYLTDHKLKDGGATRFIKDPLRHVPLAERNLDDWLRLAREDEVSLVVKPHIGSGLVFDHRLLHDSQALTGGLKIIMRTDIIFEKCGLPTQANLTHSKPLGIIE